ncbi:MAG: hypothetical protein KF886_15135 [Candidatus Hydrogenedentes bacterium]|nr:hypothetical protein [Candidatus Hydrogenedentota bacterium]
MKMNHLRWSAKPRLFVPYVLSVLWVLSTSVATAQPQTLATAEKLAANQSVTVICFGDSVTGLYYHTGGRRAYTDMVATGLQQAFPDAKVTAINAGVSGHTTAKALERIDKDVLAHRPDLVTVMFGLNDMTRVPLEDYRANLREIVAQCRAIGAEVMLCTPNNVRDTESRPTAKLLEYAAAVREVAAAEQTALADCYNAFEAVRDGDARAWAFLMSDEIHPNMAGHKLIAETIVAAATGEAVALADVPAPEPMIPHTLALIDAKQTIRILAMPPYDTLLPAVLKEAAPESEVTVTTWTVAGKSMADFEAEAKAVRDNPPDLVFIAVPAEAPAEGIEDFKRHFTWTMNWSLSFGRQEWDVVAVPPSFTGPVDGEAAERDGWQRQLIRAQDFNVLEGSPAPLEERLRAWLAGQLE